jgi:hypothetical protein
MRVRYFLFGIISVFLFSVFTVGIITVYRKSTDVVSRDGGITVFLENEDTYIISLGEESYTISANADTESFISHLLTPNILKADTSLYGAIRDIYVDFLKKLEENA